MSDSTSGGGPGFLGNMPRTTSFVNDSPQRTVIRQGGVVKVLRSGPPRRHDGGGKRAAQHGHGPRSERRMYEFLLTCKPATKIIWLTYPKSQRPDKVANNVKAYLKRLEKHLGTEISAISKMEAQQRLAPEVGIIAWDIDNLNESDAAELWRKDCHTPGTDGRL